jgi:hypothetical protein
MCFLVAQNKKRSPGRPPARSFTYRAFFLFVLSCGPKQKAQPEPPVCPPLYQLSVVSYVLSCGPKQKAQPSRPPARRCTNRPFFQDI